MIKNLYADGGVCLKNPSEYGVSWAFVATDENDTEIFQASGNVTKEACRKFKASNNLAEMMAAVRAMEYAAQNWDQVSQPLVLKSDSELTLNTIFKNYSTKRLPRNVAERCVTAMERLALHHIPVEYVLLAGHPTKKNLADGYKEKLGSDGMTKRKYPVSIHNVTCDTLCGIESGKLAPKS
jgi:ribonuclease HI